MMSSSPNNPNSTKSAARKLPIKRKSPETTDFFDLQQQQQQQQPGFKFHRVWTEQDELKFLQGLLDSTSHNLIFPRDLHLFYNRFSTSTAHPYTRSQLSEKLRRLRKKFRLISARISHGLPLTNLSQHDKALFDLSKQLWDPNHSSNSPFHTATVPSVGSVSVEVSFNPTFTARVSPSSVPIPTCENPDNGIDNDEDCDSDVGNDGVFGIVAKAVMDAFQKTLEEVKLSVMGEEQKGDDLRMRCREQSFAELDVLARRMRLLLPTSDHDDHDEDCKVEIEIEELSLKSEGVQFEGDVIMGTEYEVLRLKNCD